MWTGTPCFIEAVNALKSSFSLTQSLPLHDAVDHMSRLMGYAVMTAEGEHILLPIQVERLIESTDESFEMKEEAEEEAAAAVVSALASRKQPKQMEQLTLTLPLPPAHHILFSLVR